MAHEWLKETFERVWDNPFIVLVGGLIWGVAGYFLYKAAPAEIRSSGSLLTMIGVVLLLVSVSLARVMGWACSKVNRFVGAQTAKAMQKRKARSYARKTLPYVDVAAAELVLKVYAFGPLQLSDTNPYVRELKRANVLERVGQVRLGEAVYQVPDELREEVFLVLRDGVLDVGSNYREVFSELSPEAQGYVRSLI